MRFLWLGLVLVFECLNIVVAKVVPFIEPGFFFDYDNATLPVQPLVTQQCETIHLTWGRRNAIGPNPVAPYSFTVYSSNSSTPFTVFAGSNLEFDWQVPFVPGTQYMICMYDKNGLPGGCQDKYTVIDAATPNTSCPTPDPPKQMSFIGTVDNGPLSLFGFIDQCTDVSVQPLNGTPPFTLTIAPPLHPPFNLTSNTRDPITWTVSMSRAMPFFMSMTSADGFQWAAGPMHVGGFGPTDCLAPGTISSKKASGIAAGAGIGGLFGGAFLVAVTLLALNYFRGEKKLHPFSFYNRKSEKPESGSEIDDRPSRPALSVLTTLTEPSDTLSSQSYSSAHRSLDNPFSDTYRMRNDSISTNSIPLTANSTSPLVRPPATAATQRGFRSESLYTPAITRPQYIVQHHDAASVVYADAPDIVDLPPIYGSSSSTRSGSLSTVLSDEPPPLPEKGS